MKLNKYNDKKFFFACGKKPTRKAKPFYKWKNEHFLSSSAAVISQILTFFSTSFVKNRLFVYSKLVSYTDAVHL